MAYIKNIEIKNFRGFDSLKIKNFGQINLFVGKNNCGKSSVLESIFLLVGMSNPQLTENINRLRGLLGIKLERDFRLKLANNFKYLFHNLQYSNIPTFKSIDSNNFNRTLELHPKFSNIANNDSLNNISGDEYSTINDTTIEPKIIGLDLKFSKSKKNNPPDIYTSSITYTHNDLKMSQASNYKENLSSIFITPDSKEQNALSKYSEIVKRKKDGIILANLQKIDPRIESIHPLPEGLYFSLIGIEELVPINILGDGIRRYLSLITTVIDSPGSIILIDEIENGLHYSAHKKLWESILTFANDFNVQLFITTHNLEAMQHLKEILENENYKNMQDKSKIISISHTKKSGIKSYTYTFEGFKEAIENEIEIRD